MRAARACALLPLTSCLVLLACASPVEGAWEARVDLPAGTDPTGYEIHLALSRFTRGETAGAAEYTFFHDDGRRDQCSAKLEAIEKAGDVFTYEETITAGKCADGMVVRVTAAGGEALAFRRLDADGAEQQTATLKVQTGLPTAKGRPTG